LSPALSLVLIVGIAYFAAHILFEWIARRYRVVSGAEYLILGILLGPQVSGFMSANVVESFAPFMTLALGWTGAALGMNFYLPRLIGIRADVYKVAIAEATITFLFVSAVMLVAFAWAFDLDFHRVILPALSLGAIATAASASAVTLLNDDASHPVIEQLEITALVDSATAICGFGILLCVVHVGVSLNGHMVTATEWAAITIAIGVIGGTLFHLFIGSESDPDRLFVAMAGCIILGTGAAAYLRLSPLMPALIIGAILVNTSSRRQELARFMTTVEKPLYYVLLLFAGAAWRPSQYNWILPVLLYVFVRAAAKLGAARLSGRINGDRQLAISNWGRGLLAQGTIALAIGMSYSLNDTTLVPNVVFTAAIISVLVTDLSAVRVVSNLIRGH